MKRKALGRGLDALLPEPSSRTSVLLIDVSRIVPNPLQPRVRFPEEELAELAASIRQKGLLQPIVVRPVDDHFEIIAGERRWRAAQSAGLQQIPALVHQVADQDLLELALVENIQRSDLSPIEEAQAYRMLVDDFGLTQEEVAQRVGRSRSSVANLLRLLQLPGEIQAMVLSGELSMGHARTLVSAPRSQQISLARQTLQSGWSVRQLEERVRRTSSPSPPRITVPRPTDPNLLAAQERLERFWGTRVEIRPASDGRGTIVFHYFSEEELDRLYERFLQASP